jgi:hypothetical protein
MLGASTRASPTGMLGAGGQDRGDEQSAVEAASDMGRGVGAMLATWGLSARRRPAPLLVACNGVRIMRYRKLSGRF